MTVQQCNCYETTTLPTWETNEAELSESDKQENAAEDRSDNSLLFFAVQFCKGKIHPNGELLLRCQVWILDKKIWQSRRSVFYFGVCVGRGAIDSKVHTEIVLK